MTILFIKIESDEVKTNSFTNDDGETINYYRQKAVAIEGDQTANCEINTQAKGQPWPVGMYILGGGCVTVKAVGQGIAPVQALKLGRNIDLHRLTEKQTTALQG